MKKIELQDIIDACEESESEYIKLYRPLLGYEENLNFYMGIDDSMEAVLEEIEKKVGVEFPADFLQIYLLSNGGTYFDIDLFYLTSDRYDPKGLYSINLVSDIREQYNIPENALIIGESKDGDYILIGVDPEGYYVYSMWDKETKSEGISFAYLAEIIMHEVDYYTQAFTIDEEIE